MLKTKWLSWVVLAGLSLVVAGAARADEGKKGACREDVEKFCKGVERGGGRIMKCLKEHESELSAGCREKGKEAKGKIHEGMEKFRDACKSDVETLCKGVERGEGRILKCLREHRKDVSQKCAQTLDEAKERRREHREHGMKPEGGKPEHDSD